ncbi:MAG: CbrC family protein [Gemmatimonas sp.]
MTEPLPSFRHHPDPIRSGSVVPSDTTCRACNTARGYAYAGPVFSETDDLDDALCPWCIADGKAHRKFDATFFDSDGVDDAVPAEVVSTITERTPGFHTWQSGRWPACCNDAAAFLMPFGIVDLRASHRELEGFVLSHIIYELGISGGGATRLLNALHRDQSPTGYLFQCPTCDTYHVHIDQH